MIPIIAIVMGIGVVMLTLTLNYRRRKEMFALYHQERMAAIEKGAELPPLPDAFFTEKGPEVRSPRRSLLSGLILLFLGVALTAALWVEAPSHCLWGLLPVGVGLAYLVYYFAVGRKEAEAMEAAAQAKASGVDLRPAA